MSSKIVNIAHELADRAVNALDDEGWHELANELAAAIAAPVVERQPVETVPKHKFDTLVQHCKRLEGDIAQASAHVNEITLYQQNAVWFWQHDGEDFLTSLSCPIIIQPHHLRELLEGKAQHDPMTAPPELAELQATIARQGQCIHGLTDELIEARATIAQLETKLNNAINLDFERRTDIARLTAENERLKGGQGEPVVVPDKYDDVLLPFLSLMRNELHANAGKGDRPGWLVMTPGECLLEIYYHLGKLQKGVKDGNSMWIKEYAADVANMSMMLTDICACLDKVKELNQ